MNKDNVCSEIHEDITKLIAYSQFFAYTQEFNSHMEKAKKLQKHAKEGNVEKIFNDAGLCDE